MFVKVDTCPWSSNVDPNIHAKKVMSVKRYSAVLKVYFQIVLIGPVDKFFSVKLWLFSINLNMCFKYSKEPSRSDGSLE